MKLSKQQAKLHQQAVTLVRSGHPLTLNEREFVLENFHEGAEHMNGLIGAFFTPPGLARDFAFEVPECSRILDLCAGIGTLADACAHKAQQIVCVERNPNYVEVGRAAVPGVTWICADAFDIETYRRLGPFDVVISNPPFGAVKADGFVGRYTGSNFEYRIIELASMLAPYGVFILPQMSAPFKYSGSQCFSLSTDDRARKFREQTGITMEPGSCSIDTSFYRNEWKGTSPMCEVVCCEFAQEALPQSRSPREQIDMFGGTP